MTFTGSIDAKTDEKGRVFVPSNFRKILQKEEEDGQTLVLRCDLFEHCITLFPKSVWDARINKIRERTNQFNKQQVHAYRAYLAGALEVTMDSGGRILLPKRFLEYAGITGEVRFIGVDNTFELWSREAADSLLSEEGIGELIQEMMA